MYVLYIELLSIASFDFYTPATKRFVQAVLPLFSLQLGLTNHYYYYYHHYCIRPHKRRGHLSNTNLLFLSLVVTPLVVNVVVVVVVIAITSTRSPPTATQIPQSSKSHCILSLSTLLVFPLHNIHVAQRIRPVKENSQNPHPSNPQSTIPSPMPSYLRNSFFVSHNPAAPPCHSSINRCPAFQPQSCLSFSHGEAKC